MSIRLVSFKCKPSTKWFWFWKRLSHFLAETTFKFKLRSRARVIQGLFLKKFCHKIRVLLFHISVVGDWWQLRHKGVGVDCLSLISILAQNVLPIHYFSTNYTYHYCKTRRIDVESWRLLEILFDYGDIVRFAWHLNNSLFRLHSVVGMPAEPLNESIKQLNSFFQLCIFF